VQGVRIGLAVVAAMAIAVVGLVASAIAAFPLGAEGGNVAPVLIPGLLISLAISGAAFAGIARWGYWRGLLGAVASWTGLWLLNPLLVAITN
jgi:hypothetical protein